mgnify:CR=1 FL=1
MTILFDFTLLENDLSFFIVKQKRHAPAKWHRKLVKKRTYEKNHEKLRAKGYFNFKTPLRACTKGVFEKKSTKNYARKAISILKHPFARVRKGVFEKNYEKLRTKGLFNFKTPFRARTKRCFSYRLLSAKMCAAP